jgi:phosphatidylserine/phosphatidylglycerophosphate/cardiolipin synthase-like enzyme
MLILLGTSLTGLDAHQDLCHRRHSSPSDQGTSVCGDLGHYDHCPDTPSCQGGQPTPPLSSRLQEATCATVEVCFTPGEDCEARIVKILGEAHSSIRVQAYSFTSAPIAKILVEAQKGGVRVEAILDKSNRTEQSSAADFLANSAIPTRIDAQHAIAHHKALISDGEVVIGGSFRDTKVAQEERRGRGDHPRQSAGCEVHRELAGACAAQ